MANTSILAAFERMWQHIVIALNEKSDTTHNHDNDYAAYSHGNHVPTTQTANNAKFLRNDNTWQTVTPANIGAAASDHGEHVTFTTTTPKAAGTAAVGSATTVSRSDHVHPAQTTITGNAATATKATQDASGNVITSTYATKNELNAVSTLVGNKSVAEQVNTAIGNLDGLVYTSETNQETAVVPLNADTFGGNKPEYYAGLLLASEANANTYANNVVKKAAPVNLLDNSDFRNPVNQRGQTSYTGSYGIDRWRVWDGITMTVQNGYISSQNGAFFQYFKPDDFHDGVYTLAVKRTDGAILVFSHQIKEQFEWDWGASGLGLGIDGNVAIGIPTGDYVWAALYEGEYTIETLPEYHPKGYAVELAECKRYYQRIHSSSGLHIAGFGVIESSANKTVRLTIPCGAMRLDTVTVNISGTMYTIGSDAATNTITKCSAGYCNQIGYFINFTATNTPTSGNHMLRLQAGAYVELIADL